MSREIEFRGQLAKSKKWVSGDLVRNYWIGGNTFIPYSIRYLIGSIYSFPTEVIPETIGQYTGLKDINGTKIFENDIVKWGHVAGGLEYPIRVARVDLLPSLQFEIIQNRKQFFKMTFEYGSFMYQNTEKYLEVIGNIHDNQELLKGDNS